MTGYEALRARCAWLDLTGRGEIKVSGEDRARLLHAMTTNHVQELTPGQGCYAYFLNAQGRILADVNILCREDHFLLDTEPETRDKVFQHLDKFIIADDVLLQDVSVSLAVIAVEGPESGRVLEAIGAPVPERPYANAEWYGGLIARVSYTGAPGFRVFAPVDDKARLTDWLAQAGVERATPEESRIVRLEHGTPRYGEDITERYLAQETNQPRAVNFNKGCYLGQEIVERVRSRGQIHRVLMRIEIEATDPPSPGTKLQSDGKDVAEITFSTFSPALQKVVALAYVRTEFAKPGTPLMLNQTQAKVA